MLPGRIRSLVEDSVGEVRDVTPVGGGCIASASRVVTAAGVFFLKWADGEAGRTFEAEARGLHALRSADSGLLIPRVHAHSSSDDGEPGFLVMEWIETGRPGPDYDRLLGEGLARMHESTEPDGRYGFEMDNFIGRLPQYNGWKQAWPEFFRAMRLEPQIEMARRNGEWRSEWDRPARRLLDSLPQLLPARPPAGICHGDLWSGNAMASADGQPVLIDPAAYYGHGETDLAMMKLFGGFSARVFEVYHSVHERAPDHEEREAIYRWYHLLSHLNHFGQAYAAGVEAVLKPYN